MEAVLGLLGAAILALVSYLLHDFVTALKKLIAEAKEENERQGEALVHLEQDLNEAWFQIRTLNGRGGGRRKCRITKEWRKVSHVSSIRSVDSRSRSGRSHRQGSDL